MNPGLDSRQAIMVRLCAAIFRAAVVCAVSLSATMAFAAIRKLSLKETIDYAVEHAPGFDTQRRQLEITRLQTRNARAALLLSLDLNASLGWNDTDPRFGGAIPLSAGGGGILGSSRETRLTSALALTLTEVLYDNGVGLNNLSQSRLRERAAEIRFEERRANLALEVTQRYFNLELSRRLEEAQVTQLELIRRQHRMIAAQHRSGLKPRKDFLRFEAELRRGEIGVTSARNRTLTARQELLELIGAPSAEMDELDFASPPADVFEKLEKPASEPSLDSHYEARIAKLERETNALGVRLAQRRYWPVLDVRMSASQSHNGFIDTGRTLDDTRFLRADAIMTLSCNIWDWGILRRNVEIARANEQVLSNSIESRLLALRTDIKRLFLELDQLKDNFDLSRTLLSIEEQSYELIDRQYRDGKVSWLELTQALSTLLDAKNRLLNTRTEFVLALMRYRYHEGTLYESLAR